MKIRNVLLTAAMVTGTLFAGTGPAAAAENGAAAPLSGIGTYNLIVRTADLDNADTWDAVYFTVHGNVASSPSVRIGRDFRRDETAKFGPYRWPSVGTVTGITVRKGTSDRDAWYAEYVQVHDESIGRVYHCAINQWFEQRDGTSKWFACS